MKRPYHIWLSFGLCLAVVLAAMAWISVAALRLDRGQKSARRQAALEENVRLALWRMDSALAPLVAQESARPYFAYGTFLPVDRAYGRMFNERKGGELLLPSPLLADVSLHILVHFQYQPDGRLASPRVPLGANGDLAVPKYLSHEAMERAANQLARLRRTLPRERLLAGLPVSRVEPAELFVSPRGWNPEEGLARQLRQLERQARGRGAVEFEERNMAVMQNTNAMVQNQATINPIGETALPTTDVSGVLMTPLWLSGELLLARRVTVGGREYVQGCLLDWPGVRKWLLALVEDLLPEAQLKPAMDGPQREARMLAALPIQLVAGQLYGQTDRSLSPTALSLLVAWVCVLLAAMAVAGLLWGVMRLSARREAFVSAVTHELRTPLTTFHMYAEMLVEGMVPDRQRPEYLKTLRSEAARLSHLVENVLSFARLERGRNEDRMEDLRLGQLLERGRDRLADRAEQAGMTLVMEADEGTLATTVRVNASAADQVLFNLVDNACKYAGSAHDKRLHLTAICSDGQVDLALRDHGPGVSAAAVGNLFRAFGKSAKEAANTAPGVGLGLALSRRLARDMGGDLRLDTAATDGASFVFSLNIV